MNKIAVKLAVVLALLVGTVVATATPASAAYSCPTGVSCLYMNQGGTGYAISMPFGLHGLNTCTTLHQGYPTYAFDNAESGKNGYGSGLRLRMFEHHDCTGQTWTIPNGMTNSLGGSYMVNKTSAFMILPA